MQLSLLFLMVETFFRLFYKLLYLTNDQERLQTKLFQGPMYRELTGGIDVEKTAYSATTARTHHG